MSSWLYGSDFWLNDILYQENVYFVLAIPSSCCLWFNLLFQTLKFFCIIC